MNRYMHNNIIKLFLIIPTITTLWFVWNTSLAGERSPRLYVFDCGQLSFDSIESFGLNDDETDIRELAVPCYVIQHENGLLLWDGGLPTYFADEEGWQNVEGFEGNRARLDRTLAEQLADLKLTTADFDYAAFSHMHFDHVGAANELTGAVILMQKSEHDAAFGDEITNQGFLPDTYEGLRDSEFIILEGDHDLFGDGTVRILSMPGHTPGHQSLYVELNEYGPLILSGDLYHFRFNRANRRYPVFNDDPDATLKSIDRIEQLIEETGADLWIQHDLKLFNQLKKAPDYYR